MSKVAPLLHNSVYRQPLPTVDNNYHAVYEARRIRAKKHCRLLDIGDPAKTS